MRGQFLGKISFQAVLEHERSAFTQARLGDAVVLGFETGPVITLGRHANDQDILDPRGFEIVRLERGGQATLHNPGQLVIFPILPLRGLGTRAWVDGLLEVTRITLIEFGKTTRCQDGRPGLFSDHGKVVSVGLRVREGVSTHGLSINVCNELADFKAIRACGVTDAAVDRLGADYSIEGVFKAWLKNFERWSARGLTSDRNLTNLDPLRDVRL